MKKIITCFAFVAMISMVASAQMVNKGYRLFGGTEKTSFERQLITNYIGKSHEAVLPTKDGAVTATDVQAVYWGSYTEVVGEWGLQFFNGDDLVMNVVVNTSSATNIAGNYTIDGTTNYALIVAGVGDTVEDATGTFSITFVNSGTEFPLYSFSGSFSNGTRSFTINGDFEVLAFDYYIYMMAQYGMASMADALITLTDDPNAPTGMPYDAVDQDYDEEFTASEVEFDDSDLATYGVIYVSGESATTNAIAQMIVFVGDAESGASIPAGTYLVDDSQMPGTILASSGVQNNSVYPSFAGYLSEDGQGITIPLWFMEGGSATVTSNRIEVNATNSNGRNIHIVMNNGVGINDVENAQVSVYPNPATTQLNVVAEGVNEIQVIDVNGSIVMSRHQAGAIDISNLSNGIYVVRTLTNEGVNVQKIVKK